MKWRSLGNLGVVGVASRWSVRKQVLCPACNDVMADVVHRIWPGTLTVRTPEGYEVMPRRSAAVERELDAGGDRLSGVGDPEELRAMLRRYHADLVYELTCPRGHLTVSAAPQLVHAVRRASGAWVHLS